MNTPKCRCSDCGKLVERWIGMTCVPCHDRAVIVQALQSLTLSVVLPGVIREIHAEVAVTS